MRVIKFTKHSILLIVFMAASSFNSLKCQSIDNYVKWEENITLQENKSVINVLPFVAHDPKGGFIVTDFKESQIRFYGKHGRLKSYFGRRGRGPGELVYPTASCRLPDGDIVVGEFMGELNRFTANGDSLKKSFIIPNFLLNDLYTVNNNKVLLVGYKKDKPDTSLLFIYNLKNNNIEKRFFKVPKPLGTYGGVMYATKTLSNANVYHDKIIANFGLDTMFYLFDLQGNLIKKVHADLPKFRHVKKNKKNVGKEALTAFSTVLKTQWYSNDSFLVYYQDIMSIAQRKFKSTLALINLDGKVLFEAEMKGGLLVTSPGNSKIYFQKSYDKPANQWSVGTIKK